MPTVLITGGHSGLGLAASTRIAATGRFDLVLAGRNPERVEGAASHLRRAYSMKVTTLVLDMSSLASVRSAAEHFKRMVAKGETGPLHTLVLNAGAQFLGKVSFSADGYEETFAINCLGNFLLFNLLLDGMDQDGRVVFVASGTHDPATMDGKLAGAAVEPDAVMLANQGKQGKPIRGSRRYSTSKLCTILYAYELHRRLRAAGAGIASIAFDPGMIPETGLLRTMPILRGLNATRPMKWLSRRLGITMGSIPVSGAGLADVAISPLYADASGKYIQSNNGRVIERCSSTASYDKAAAAKLWADSGLLVHLLPEERPQLLPKD